MDMKIKNQTLRQPTKAVTFRFPLAAKILADNLYNFMKQEGGIGLAANQVGLRDRVFVMEIDGERFNVFNPSVLKYSDEVEDAEEGCLSFPNETATVRRSKTVTVIYQEENGVTMERTLNGLAARCFQHEYDHLHGFTMFDRVRDEERREKAKQEQETE